MIGAMMKSREFRKYYFFIRKYYYDKLQYLERNEMLGRDQNGNFVFYYPGTNPYKDIEFSKKELRKMRKRHSSMGP